MKDIKKILNKEEGFTLVELMIVVAIIGLLSAVAIPNFKKYQAKAKTSEAKLQLSAAYTAEQAFFTDYGMYHNCLETMGFSPVNEYAARYYVVGINVATAFPTAATDAYTMAATAGLNANCLAANPAAPALTNIGSVTGNAAVFLGGKTAAGGIPVTAAHITGSVYGAALTVTPVPPVTIMSGVGLQTTQNLQSFRVGAAGIIDSAHTGLCSGAANVSASCMWIDQSKRIQSVRDGF